MLFTEKSLLKAIVSLYFEGQDKVIVSDNFLIDRGLDFFRLRDLNYITFLSPNMLSLDSVARDIADFIASKEEAWLDLYLGATLLNFSSKEDKQILAFIIMLGQT